MTSSKRKNPTGPGQVIHFLQHVPYEGIAAIENWTRSHHHVLSGTALYLNEPLPDIHSFDWLIILGGPMNVYEQDKYPWLKDEKRLIRMAIERKKRVLGICLGAQLIADVLGAKITANRYREVGWHPIASTPHRLLSKLFSEFPEHLNTFHWHGDTFAIPRDSIHGFSSQACENQAFDYEGRVVGLQFHLECTEESIRALIEHCPQDLRPAPHVQTAKEILSQTKNLPINHLVLYQLLDRMETITTIA